MFLSWVISILLVLATVVIHYEALRTLAGHVDQLKLPLRVRLRMVVVMLSIFVAHIVEVLIFAAGFYLASHVLDLGVLLSQVEFGDRAVSGTFRDFLYFSAVSYTSLGLGDIFPTGGLRLITGIEALTGLLMITWSASFTYLYMQKFWKLGRPGGGLWR